MQEHVSPLLSYLALLLHVLREQRYVARNACPAFSENMATSGSYELRSLCKTCQITLNSREAASWLTHGQYLIATDKKYLEAALAMYNLSNELCPSETATIRQAQALFSCEKHERVVQYGKGILRTARLSGKILRSFRHW